MDLSKDTRWYWLLQFLALVMFGVFGTLFVALARFLRADIPLTGALTLETVGGVILALVVMVLAHEAAHGLFFWHFTHARPKFGLGLTYAYAGAPDWYIPRNQYLVVGLAPLVLITGVGGLLLLIVPPAWLWLLVAVLTFNASGAVGDLMMVGWCLLQAPEILVQDTGMSILLYGPVA